MASNLAKTYTPEFKVEAVRRVIDLHETENEVAESMGCSARSIRNWINDKAIYKAAEGGSEDIKSELNEIASLGATLVKQKLRTLNAKAIDPKRMMDLVKVALDASKTLSGGLQDDEKATKLATALIGDPEGFRKLINVVEALGKSEPTEIIDAEVTE